MIDLRPQNVSFIERLFLLCPSSVRCDVELFASP